AGSAFFLLDFADVFLALEVVFFFAGVFFLAVFFAGLLSALTASAGACLAACFAGVLAPKRPRRTGAAAISSLHSSSVNVFGSRSLGIFAFFTRSVMYGPK